MKGNLNLFENEENDSSQNQSKSTDYAIIKHTADIFVQINY